MPSPFDTDWQSAAPVFAEVFGQPLVYRRGTNEVSLTGQIAVLAIEARPDAGVYESWRGIAVVFASADLVLSGEEISPAAGDEIADGDLVYTVLPPPAKPVCEPTDPDGYEVVVYAKLRRE